MGNRLSAIATRTGDDGTSGLADGSRVPKTATVMHAMGDVDELNSHIGLLLTEALPADLTLQLQAIQNDLFNLGGELALPGHALLSPDAVSRLDRLLAQYNAELPRLREFVLPGGTRAAAQLHVCRTTCRRAERSLLAHHHATAPEDTHTAQRQYLNRLSDLCFVLARWLNQQAGNAETQWGHQR